MDDEGSAVLREDVFIEPVEEDICICFPHCIAVIPGRRADKAMIRPFIPAIEQGASEGVLQTAKCLYAFHDICYGDSFTEIVKQLITEGFKADRCEHDLHSLPPCKGQDSRKVRCVSIDVIDPAHEMEFGEPDPMPFNIFKQFPERAHRVFVYELEGNLPFVPFGQS